MDPASTLAAAHEQFGPDRVAMLRTHLEAQIAVEFFTIPFYLTAVYSFTNKALSYRPDGGTTQPFFDLQQKTLSVAVQEMYHLQEACNLANAFGVTPDLPAAVRSFPGGADIVIPHLDPDQEPLVASLGNLPHAIQVMIEIETPDDSGTLPPPNATATYPSIGDLYGNTLRLLGEYLDAFGDVLDAADPHFQPGHKQVAYGAFATRYKYNAINKRSDVAHAAGAIVDQGEGPEVVPKNWPIPKEQHSPAVEKQYWSTGRFATYDKVTHFARFETIEKALPALTTSFEGAFYEPGGTPSTELPSTAPDLETCQQAVDTLWSYLLDTMLTGFQTGGLSSSSPGNGFTNVMISFKYALPLVWQHGACPAFGYREGVTDAEVEQALDVVDPLNLVHWDAATQKVRSEYPKNACQGLNACKGQGWGGIATEAGNGACATADFHTCQGGNDCSHQGGCGFLSTDAQGHDLAAEDQWVPGQNDGKTTGGCQTPISSGQVFNSGAEFPTSWDPAEKQSLQKLKGTHVWDHARKLFQATHNLDTLPTSRTETKGGIDYNGTKRRAAVSATSTS